MRLRFLADANLDQDIVVGLWRRQPAVDFALPQHHLAEGAEDLEVLAIAAGMDAVLVTHDARTMPFHFAAFLQSSPSPGVILVPRLLPIALAIEELLLIWEASSPEDWVDQFRRLPL